MSHHLGIVVGGGGGRIFRFGCDGGVRLKPKTPYPSSEWFLGKVVHMSTDFLQKVDPCLEIPAISGPFIRAPFTLHINTSSSFLSLQPSCCELIDLRSIFSIDAVKSAKKFINNTWVRLATHVHGLFSKMWTHVYKFFSEKWYTGLEISCKKLTHFSGTSLYVLICGPPPPG